MQFLATTYMYLVASIVLYKIQYVNCSKSDVSVTSLKDALKLASGVYIDNQRSLNNQELKNTVMITVVNEAFIAFFMNLKCSLDRLGLKILVLAMDKNSYNYLKRITPVYFYRGDLSQPEITGAANQWREKQYDLLSDRRNDAYIEILELGYNFFGVDTDVILVNDPMHQISLKNVDFVFVSDDRKLGWSCVHCKKNTTTNNNSLNILKSKQLISQNVSMPTGGTFYASSNALVLSFLYNARNVIRKRRLKYPKAMTYDQLIWGGTLNYLQSVQKLRSFANCEQTSDLTRITNDTLQVCWLDPCSHKNGDPIFKSKNQWIQYNKCMTISNQTIYTVHANFLVGRANKGYSMERNGLWLYNNSFLDDDHTHLLSGKYSCRQTSYFH